MSWAHTHTERVRFGDLDAMKHLNNVVFLRYFETARINYLNQLMDSHDPVFRADGFGFIFASCTIDYRSPAHFDEDVEIRVRPADIGTKSLKLEFEMAVGERLIADGHGILVGYDYETGETLALPDALKKRLR
jgi:acyl-CoA thioester hydrolase